MSIIEKFLCNSVVEHRKSKDSLVFLKIKRAKTLSSSLHFLDFALRQLDDSFPLSTFRFPNPANTVDEFASFLVRFNGASA
ncbi:hypothetical protein [Alloprevotella tannerae]|uniref:hypothetical protein n=1 Tax=Alloprevotella tannerae TaxID=76122 RepID=UPI001EDC2039|nr:hypothetical protein [Alloprevotella tannerae]